MSTSSDVLILPAGDSHTISQAVRILNQDGVIAVPTDTVYGLVCRYDSESAIERIYEIKGRPANKPLPVLLGTATEMALVTSDVPEAAWSLIYKFWPGPLTIVLPSHRSLSRRITGGKGTVGVRVPAHPAVLDILEALRFPLASTSANLSGESPAETANEAVARIGTLVDLIITSDESALSGRSSTVVDLTVKPYLIRRQGDITRRQLREELHARVELATES